MANKRTPPIDWSKLDGMLLFDPSLNVCADEMGVSHDTLERAIKAKFQLTFGEYKRQKVNHTAYKLKQKMINKAFEGDNTCLIFSLKNLSDWADKIDHGFNEDKKQILLKYSIEPKTVGPKPDKGTTE